jgi:membrane-associated phospholipid phosphatase
MPPTSPPQVRFAITMALSLVIILAVSIGWLDRPLASWSHATLHGMAPFVWLTWIAEPLPSLAALGLAGCGVAALAGWRPGPRGRALLAVCLATLVAVEIKELLKYAFGRTWPETWTNGNPSWIANGVFGFYPFHGGAGWASFPSGHTTTIATPMAALWRVVPRGRWLWVGLVAVVAVGLIGADYHWLSDIIAGAALGLATGLGMVAVMAGPPRRSDESSPKV